MEQLLYPFSEECLNERKNQKLLLRIGLGIGICGGGGLWATLFMYAGNVAPSTLKIVASVSGGSVVLSLLPFLLSQITSRITKDCFRKASVKFQGYNLWNEDAMSLRRAVAYLRLLDGAKISSTARSVTNN